MEQLNVRWYVDNVSANSAAIAITSLPCAGHVRRLLKDQLISSLSAMEDTILHLSCNKISSLPGTDKLIPAISFAGLITLGHLNGWRGLHFLARRPIILGIP
jgi:hypothetical protein